VDLVNYMRLCVTDWLFVLQIIANPSCAANRVVGAHHTAQSHIIVNCIKRISSKNNIKMCQIVFNLIVVKLKL
jgi:hypothetical protein